MRRDPWSDSCPDIPDILFRPSRFKFSAQLCYFGSKSGCGATLGVIHFGIFQTLCPDFPDPNSRTTMKLGLNQYGERPLTQLMSRHSRSFVPTFQTQTLGATLHFKSKSGCGAARGAIHVQTFETLCSDIPDSISWRGSAIWV